MRGILRYLPLYFFLVVSYPPRAVRSSKAFIPPATELLPTSRLCSYEVMHYTSCVKLISSEGRKYKFSVIRGPQSGEWKIYPNIYVKYFFRFLLLNKLTGIVCYVQIRDVIFICALFCMRKNV